MVLSANVGQHRCMFYISDDSIKVYVVFVPSQPEIAKHCIFVIDYIYMEIMMLFSPEGSKKLVYMYTYIYIYHRTHV